VAGGRAHEIVGIKLRPAESEHDSDGQAEQAKPPF
jgi:hypothetical protein